MKRSVIAIATILCCVMLASCGIKPREKVRISEATSVDQILEDVRKSIDDEFPVYSELAAPGDYIGYFSILGDNEYMIKKIRGAKYIFINVNFNLAGGTLTDIKNVEYEYSDNRLDVAYEFKAKESLTVGCLYIKAKGGIILKVDKDWDTDDMSVLLEGKKLDRFKGGRVKVRGKVGMVDEDMKIILPIRYDDIFDFDMGYYRVYRKGKNGIVDNEYNVVLSAKYNNISYLGDDRYAAMIDIKDSSDYRIVLLDSDENILRDDLIGFIEVRKPSKDYLMYTLLGDGTHVFTGVLDFNLDFVIEPVYKDIVEYTSDGGQTYFVAENYNEEFAVFNAEGEQTTEFEKQTSFYGMAEKYIYTRH